MLEVLDPSGRPREPHAAEPDALTVARRPIQLDGARLALLDNLKPGASDLLDGFRTGLKERFDLDVTYWKKSGLQGASGPFEFSRELAQRSGAVLNAVGD